MQRRILEAHKMVRAALSSEARQQIDLFDARRYNAAASVQDIILCGEIVYGEADALLRIPEILAKVIDGHSLRQVIIDGGLNYPVETGGARLLAAERQKVAIARAGAHAARPSDS